MQVERSGQMKQDKEAKEEKSVYSTDSYLAVFLTGLSTAIQRVYIVQDTRGISKVLTSGSGNHSSTQHTHPSDSCSALPSGAFSLYTPVLVAGHRCESSYRVHDQVYPFLPPAR